MFKLIRFLLTYGLTFALGFALGIYLLPVLIAPDAPSEAELSSNSQKAVYQADFHRKLAASDLLHWGEGQLSITERPQRTMS